MPAVRLNAPQTLCDVVIATIPTRKRDSAVKVKDAIDAKLCGRYVVRGNMPMAERVSELRIRLVILILLNLLGARLLPRPAANMRLSIPVIIRQLLNSHVVLPATPKTLIYSSLQLNHGELAIINRRTVHPPIGEIIPQTPPIFLNIMLSNGRYHLAGLSWLG